MKIRKQRIMGLVLIMISVIIMAVASTGKTTEDRDATAALITLPLGVYMLVSKTYILYDGDTDDGSAAHQTETPPPTAPPPVRRRA